MMCPCFISKSPKNYTSHNLTILETKNGKCKSPLKFSFGYYQI